MSDPDNVSKELTPDDIRSIVEDEDFSVDDMRELLKEEFDVDVPEGLEGDTEKYVQFIYDIYSAKAEEISTSRKKSRERTKKNSSEAKKSGGLSRVSFIEGFIKDLGKTTVADVTKALDDAFGYTAAGRSPKTRVNRTLKNLEASGQVDKDGTNITWTGK